MLNGKKIVVGITGSIAAYKTLLLVRQLRQHGADVQVLLTPAARDFVSPLVLSTLSQKPVLADMFTDGNWANHVALGRWADLMLIAPLSCNTLAKMAQGHCDNLLLAVYLSATCPVWVAPAMDSDMWHHPATQHNLQLLQQRGHRVLPVGTGPLASGLVGEGRMCEPEDILAAVKNYFQEAQLLSGKSIVITAGPTYESIDAVRFIGNRSSGKMGMALADACTRLGASVTLISGPVSVQPKLQPQHHIKVRTAAEMHAAVTDVFDQADIVIMAAAVADYTPANKASGKIKKGQNTLVLELQPTVDILKELGARKKPNQILVGFALETDNGDAYAQKKLEQKNADAIVLNLQSDAGSGFEHDTNQVSIFLRNGEVRRFPLQPKEQVATAIVQTILELLHG